MPKTNRNLASILLENRKERVGSFSLFSQRVIEKRKEKGKV